MLFLLTDRYEVRNSDIIIYSFIFRTKSFPISDILFIEEEGMFSKSRKSSIGPDWVRLHLKGGRKITIASLAEQYKFVQLIRSKLSS